MNEDALTQVLAYYRTDDAVAAANAAFIVEGGKPVRLQQGWTYRADPPHTTGMQHHVHVYLKGNEKSVINRDGTQSHGTTRKDLPNWVANRIKAKGLIEGALLTEASGAPIVVVPPEIIGAALSHSLQFGAR